ncbi:MAG TPA: hypothetical protein VIX35_06300, partial [Vicinamibacterales bacterium]
MNLGRARFLTLLAGSAALTGCSGIATSLNENHWFHGVLESPERLDMALLGADQPLARLYSEKDISPNFRHNGFDPPSDPTYTRWSQNDWRGYRLFVTGLVERPTSYDMPELRTRFT